MRSSRDKAVDKMSELLEMISAERMLDYLITNHLSGHDAFNAMESIEEEFFPNEDEEDEEDDFELEGMYTSGVPGRDEDEEQMAERNIYKSWKVASRKVPKSKTPVVGMVYRGLDKFFGKDVVGVLVELYPDYDEAVLKSADNKLISVIIQSLKIQVHE